MSQHAGILFKTIAAISLLAISGCATGFDKSNTNAIKRIAVIAPENPTGHLPVVTSPPPSGPTAVYVPPGGGLIGAAVAGLAIGLIQGAQKNANQQSAETEAAMRLDYATFLTNANVALGDELANETRDALRRGGYDIADGSKPADPQGADATLTFEILDLGIGTNFSGDTSPQLKVKATLRKVSTKTVMYEKTFHYSGGVHSMWDQAIQADPKYTAPIPELRGDHDKLLIEGVRAGAVEIANHIGAALSAKQVTASAAH